MSTLDGELRVECEMTNPPRPTGFVVLVEGKNVAVLTLEQIEKALAEYRRMDLTLRLP